MNPISQFRSSLREFRSLRSVILAAMLLAIHTVLSIFISIQVTESVRISISFIANVLTGCLFGPAVGLVNGALGDILQFLIKPSGSYFPGWTINAALAGLFYGMAFYKKLPRTALEQSSGISDKRLQLTDHLIALTTPATLLCWAAAPFLTITEQAEDTASVILTDGSALQILLHWLGFSAGGEFSGQQAGKSALMLSVLILIVSILTGILILRKRRMFSMLLSTLTSFALLLALYTDKKTTDGHWGFYLIAALFFCISLYQLAVLAPIHALDTRYLLRTLLVTTIVCLIVNALLGTYWCVVMYGNHFMVYFMPRFIKNLIQVPINTALIYYLLRALATIPEFRRLISENSVKMRRRR